MGASLKKINHPIKNSFFSKKGGFLVIKRLFLSLGISGLIFFLVLNFVPKDVLAWTEPSDSPPNGTVAAPLNTSITGQTKSGDLTILGNVGIGTAASGVNLNIDKNAASGVAEVQVRNSSIPIDPINNPEIRLNLGMGGESMTGGDVAGTGYLTLTGLDRFLLRADKSTGYIDFATGGTAATDVRMRINKDGRVSIGETAQPQGANDTLAAFSDSTDQSAIYGEQKNTSGWAGYFSGNVNITNQLCLGGVCQTSWGNTDAGIITPNIILVPKNLVTNGGMEGDYSGAAPGWTVGGPTITAIASSGSHTGTEAQSISETGSESNPSSDSFYQKLELTQVIPGKHYLLSFWAKDNSAPYDKLWVRVAVGASLGNEPNCGGTPPSCLNDSIQLSNSYQRHSFPFIAGNGDSYLQFGAVWRSSMSDVIIDDISLIEVDAAGNPILTNPAFTVTTDGNVGIGTTGLEKLTVSGGNILVTDSVGNGGWLKGYDDHHSIYFREGGVNKIDYYEYGGTLASGSGHKFYTGGLKSTQTLKMQIADDGTYFSGNVGLNEIGPKAKFSVGGSGSLGDTIAAYANSGVNTSTIYAEQSGSGYAGSFSGNVKVTNAGNTGKVIADQLCLGSDSNCVLDWSSNFGLWAQNGQSISPRNLTLNVGIGTKNPVPAGKLLAVAGEVYPSGGNCPIGYDWYDENNNGSKDIGECKKTGLAVISSGNVGVGINNPGAKLTVSTDSGQIGSSTDTVFAYADPGGTAISALQNNPSGWAGYFSGNVNITNPTSTSQLCLNGVCKTAWPVGGGASYWTLSGSNLLYPNQTNYSVAIGGTGISAPFYFDVGSKTLRLGGQLQFAQGPDQLKLSITGDSELYLADRAGKCNRNGACEPPLENPQTCPQDCLIVEPAFNPKNPVDNLISQAQAASFIPEAQAASGDPDKIIIESGNIKINNSLNHLIRLMNTDSGAGSAHADFDFGKAYGVRLSAGTAADIQSWGNQPLFIQNIGQDTYINAQNGGKVGIGTTEPNYKLHIVGTDQARAGNYDGILYVADDRPLAANVGGSIVFGGHDDVNRISPFGKIGSYKENTTPGNDSVYMSFFTHVDDQSNFERIRITSDGNIGIGTPKPAGKLNVTGDVIDPVIPLEPQQPYCPSGYDWYDENNNGSKDIGECKRTGLAVMSGGNVGIGNAAPGAKLTIGNNPNHQDPDGSSGDAIYAYTDSANAAISAENPTGYAGYFVGKAYISDNVGVGTFPAGAKLTIAGAATAIEVRSTSNDAIRATSDIGYAGYFSGKTYVSGNVGIGAEPPAGGAKLTVTATGTAIEASGRDNYAIYGRVSTGSGGNSVGVYGEGTSDTAVNYGVFGITKSSSGYGVYGKADKNSGTNYGVFGETISTTGYGVYGKTPAGSTGYAGYFEGNVNITGSINTAPPGTWCGLCVDGTVNAFNCMGMNICGNGFCPTGWSKITTMTVAGVAATSDYICRKN